MIIGIIPFALNPEISFFPALSCSVFLCCVFCIFLDVKHVIKVAIFATAAFILTLNARTPSEKNYDSMLPNKNCGAIIEAEVADTTCSSQESAEWLPQPYLMKISVLRFKYTESDTWHETEGLAATILPRECPRLEYGDKILLKGNFNLPEPPLFKGDFDFKKYLLANGMRRVFDAEDCEIMRKCGNCSIYHNIMSIRDFLMNKTVSGMKDVENKKIAAAIIFGCRQGLSVEDRRNFLKSGTIHVFSISGLHVGIMAVMLFWIFRWLPFRARHLIIPAIIFVYVFTTGMSPPAVRSFLMISVWCIQRAFLYPSSSLNSVFVAAAIILLFNPFAMLDVGFQFSFIVAGFLVLSWNSSEKLVSSALETVKWIPAQQRFSVNLIKNKLTVNILRSFITSLVAWLSGMGLCLVYQGLFSSSSILTNFAIIPFVSLFFGAVIAKIAFFPLCPVANLANFVSEWSLDIIRNVSEAGASFGNEYLLKPPLWILVIFYIAVILVVISERKRTFIISAAVVIAVIGFWYWNNTFSSGSVYIICGGESQEPVIAVCPPGDSGAFIVNAGSKQAARPLMNLLYRKGVDVVDTLLICESRKDFCGGSRYVLSGIRVSQLVMPEKYKQSWFSKKTVETAENEGCGISFISGENGKIFKKGNITCRFEKKGNMTTDWFIEYILREQSLKIKIINGETGVKKIEINTEGANNILELMNTNVPVLREFDFKI
ncbi:MAG: ComEC/Rec2 family competence protein [Victivallales bacterium]